MSDITELITKNGLRISSKEGEKASFVFGSQGDLCINNTVRKSEGRALVVGDNDDRLYLNYANDFKGGVFINNLNLKHIFKDLPKAPSGINTFDIVMDADGNVYKKD